MKVTLVQDEPILGNPDATLDKMERLVKQAKAATPDTDCILFPELFISGYLPRHWPAIPSKEDETNWFTRLCAIATNEQVWLVVGHPSYRVPCANTKENPLTNAASLISSTGEIVGTYAKVHLYGEEEDTFHSGTQWPVWNTPWGRIALQICYDIEFPESARMAALQHADVLFNISANMSPYGPYHELYCQSRAMENSMFVVCLNRTGVEDDLEFCGQSSVAHPNRMMLLTTGRETGIFTVHLPLQERHEMEDCVQYLSKRRPDTYAQITSSKIEV